MKATQAEQYLYLMFISYESEFDFFCYIWEYYYVHISSFQLTEMHKMETKSSAIEIR